MQKIRLPKNTLLKILIILLAVPIVLYLLPFVIGGFIIKFVFRHLNNKVLRNSFAVALLLPTLFIGTAWAAGFTQAIVAPETISTSPTPSQRPTLAPTSTPAPTIAISEAPTPTSTPTPELQPTLRPTVKPYVQPTRVFTPLLTETPVKSNIQTVAPPTTSSGGGFICNCSKTCPQMSSCSEAQYQLNSCGCSARDADDDGVACDADCQ